MIAGGNPLCFLLLLLSSHSVLSFSMTWSQTWNDILTGGSPRWIVSEMEHKKTALDHILANAGKDGPLNILCPLAGNDMFVKYAWDEGHSIVAIDLVQEALADLRKQFGSDGWVKEEAESKVVWKHQSDRVTLYEGDMLVPVKSLAGSFDVVYDKDSFGALDKHLRQAYCERLSEYVKPGGMIYTEVKNKPEGPGREQGPPFHVEKEDLMEASSFGGAFEYAKSLGEVYPLKMPGFSQMGHILKRLPK